MPEPKRSPTTFMPAIRGPSITSRGLDTCCRHSSTSPSMNSSMPFTSACVSRSVTGSVRHCAAVVVAWPLLAAAFSRSTMDRSSSASVAPAFLFSTASSTICSRSGGMSEYTWLLSFYRGCGGGGCGAFGLVSKYARTEAFHSSSTGGWIAGGCRQLRPTDGRTAVQTHLEHAGVDDAHVHARGDGVVEEDGVHGLADDVHAAEAEGEVRDAARDLGVRAELLDPAGVVVWGREGV